MVFIAIVPLTLSAKSCNQLLPASLECSSFISPPFVGARSSQEEVGRQPVAGLKNEMTIFRTTVEFSAFPAPHTRAHG